MAPLLMYEFIYDQEYNKCLFSAEGIYHPLIQSAIEQEMEHIYTRTPAEKSLLMYKFRDITLGPFCYIPTLLVTHISLSTAQFTL